MSFQRYNYDENNDSVLFTTTMIGETSKDSRYRSNNSTNTSKKDEDTTLKFEKRGNSGVGPNGASRSVVRVLLLVASSRTQNNHENGRITLF